MATATRRELRSLAGDLGLNPSEFVLPNKYKTAVLKHKSFTLQLMRALVKGGFKKKDYREVNKITTKQWGKINTKWKAEVRKDPSLVTAKSQPSKKGLKALKIIVISVTGALALTGTVMILIGTLICCSGVGIPAGVIIIISGTVALCLSIGVSTLGGILVVLLS